jgi:hypothetical protein
LAVAGRRLVIAPIALIVPSICPAASDSAWASASDRPGTGLVNAIELWRPTERDIVRYHDIDVFGLPAREVVARLRHVVNIEPNENDNGFTARDVYLALWRPFAADDDPTEEQGYFFQSVLMARPGYDDTPVEAAARLEAGGQPGY